MLTPCQDKNLEPCFLSFWLAYLSLSRLHPGPTILSFVCHSMLWNWVVWASFQPTTVSLNQRSTCSYSPAESKGGEEKVNLMFSSWALRAIVKTRNKRLISWFHMKQLWWPAVIITFPFPVFIWQNNSETSKKGGEIRRSQYWAWRTNGLIWHYRVSYIQLPIRREYWEMGREYCACISVRHPRHCFLRSKC